ncbi:tetratricopeptide repeat protein 28-like [Scleropages formosus]|uniref:Tetratricopeptide repeat protein 28-like n=1 Tax=Scleropages formosus TaxID=113540 RepID=A0A0P7WSC7_SCLFO|nr:tetratricopeptide repeat protein 28-like [Scleropages formosus]
MFPCQPPTESLEPTYQQLQKMKLDKSPFVVVSVIGQELLSAGHQGASVVVLEAALKIGTCSLKLRGSVFSALSSAYWSLGNTEKSTSYMQHDLEVAKTLGDQTGECRAHGNLGSAFFSKGNYREALTNHRHQLVLAMKLKDREATHTPGSRGANVGLRGPCCEPPAAFHSKDDRIHRSARRGVEPISPAAPCPPDFLYAPDTSPAYCDTVMRVPGASAHHRLQLNNAPMVKSQRVEALLGTPGIIWISNMEMFLGNVS